MTVGDRAASRSPLALDKSQLNFSTGIPKPAHCCSSWFSNSPCSGRVYPHLRNGVCISVSPTNPQGRKVHFCIFLEAGPEQSLPSPGAGESQLSAVSVPRPPLLSATALGWLPEPIQQPQNSSRCSQGLLQSCGMCRTSCPAAPQLCRASCCPIPTGLRAPPGCSDSGKKFPALFTGSSPTSSACGWGLEEKHMDPNISENISVSYPRASQR